jgi:hypothetical protein
MDCPEQSSAARRTQSFALVRNPTRFVVAVLTLNPDQQNKSP